MYRFLMLLTIASTAGLQTWQSLFNNFAVDKVGINGNHMGIIQSLREVPGFLALLVVFCLLFIKEYRLSALSIVILGAGVIMTGLLPSFAGLIASTLVMSFGYHYYETTNQSLTLQYFDLKSTPWVLGKQRSYTAAANVVIGVLIFFVQPYMSYLVMYLLFGSAILFMGLWAFSQNPSDKNAVPQRKKMFLRKKYSLYYILNFLSGARRQIFTAFAVFLMVKKFNYTVQGIVVLFIINNVINYFLNPLIGRAINRLGERKLMTLEYTSVFFIFIGYAIAQSQLQLALLYIMDQIFFNFSIAIRTYFQKIGDPRDIAPTMAVGFTINHIAAVVLPAVGGMLWLIDYRLPFIIGAGLSVISLLVVQQIRIPIKQNT